MSDDQVVRLLEEIVTFRAMQKRGVQRSQAAFVGSVVLFIFLGWAHLASPLSWFFNWNLRH